MQGHAVRVWDSAAYGEGAHGSSLVGEHLAGALLLPLPQAASMTSMHESESPADLDLVLRIKGIQNIVLTGITTDGGQCWGRQEPMQMMLPELPLAWVMCV